MPATRSPARSRSRSGIKRRKQIDLSTLSDKTLSGLAAAINAAAIGVTAYVVTSKAGSTLTLAIADRRSLRSA